MFSVTLLSGETITLPVENAEEFKRLYLETYIKPKFRPFVTLEILQNEFLLVNIHPLLPQLEKEEYTSSEWRRLSENPSAIPFLRQHLDKVCWESLSGNPGAIELLKENIDEIDWSNLSCNSSAEELIRLYPEKIYWYGLAELHPNASELLSLAPLPYTEYLIHLSLNEYAAPEWFIPYMDHMTSLIWKNISSNARMIPLLTENLDRVNTSLLCMNPGAAQLLAIFPLEELHEDNLKENPSPELARMVEKGLFSEMEWSFEQDSDSPLLIHKLREHPDQINWSKITYNSAAADLVEQYVDRVTNWKGLTLISNSHLIPKYIKYVLEDGVPSAHLYRYESVFCPVLDDF